MVAVYRAGILGLSAPLVVLLMDSCNTYLCAAACCCCHLLLLATPCCVCQ